VSCAGLGAWGMGMSGNTGAEKKIQDTDRRRQARQFLYEVVACYFFVCNCGVPAPQITITTTCQAQSHNKETRQRPAGSIPSFPFLRLSRLESHSQFLSYNGCGLLSNQQCSGICILTRKRTISNIKNRHHVVQEGVAYVSNIGRAN